MLTVQTTTSNVNVRPIYCVFNIMCILKKTLVTLSVLVIFAKTGLSQQCNGGAECIVFQSCSGLYSQLMRESNAQLTQLLRSLHCGFQDSNPKICCPPEFRYERTNEPRVQQNTNQYDPISLLPNTRTCGIQNNDRIVGGEMTDIDEHPWMTLLRYDKPVGWGFYCGGVLISEKYVLTAAHCVGGELPAQWRLTQVRLGEWNTSSATDCVSGDCTDGVQDIPVEEINVHERYSAEDNNELNDIALLRLARPASFNDFVKPICLPLNEDVRRSTFDGYDMEVAGWGKTENRSESNIKLKVRVPIVRLSQCAEVFKKVGREVKNTQICAGGTGGRDSCRGDSGGPLMGQPKSGNNWMVLGIVSYGPTPCGTPNWPGVYTRVGAYVDWILSKMRP